MKQQLVQIFLDSIQNARSKGEKSITLYNEINDSVMKKVKPDLIKLGYKIEKATNEQGTLISWE